ncbi:MAG: hypothetical protein LQ350_007333 [Teloschistes chrysophthalmus]|nr:MAG: hypothetical protein LQ350_007333 [Niorma chrysophthalma]
MSDRLIPKETPKASHGRGGVGNIGPTTNDARNNLVTPTIKQSVYTTGRGGSGNMKKNDPNHPEVARKSQDVAPMPRRNSRGEIVHTGRGGVANVIRPSIDEMVHTATDEDAIMEDEREMKDSGAPHWWRDDMANGRAKSR